MRKAGPYAISEYIVGAVHTIYLTAPADMRLTNRAMARQLRHAPSTIAVANQRLLERGIIVPDERFRGGGPRSYRLAP